MKKLKYVELNHGVGPVLDRTPTIVYCIDRDEYFYEEGTCLANLDQKIPKPIAETLVPILKPHNECGHLNWLRFCRNCGLSYPLGYINKL